MEAKLQAIYESAPKHLKIERPWPRVMDLDPKKVGALIVRITTDLKAKWFDRENPLISHTLRYCVGGSSGDFDRDYFIVIKNGSPYDYTCTYMGEACQRVQAALSGQRFGLSVDVQECEGVIELEWSVVAN